jgi:alginate O-acetyltransferase complex protein AlgF
MKMQFRFVKKFHNIVFTALLICLGLTSAQAQPAGLLYDPEPPADSAYVRVILTSRDGPVDILVDGRSRIRNLGASEFSDYMVLNAGKRTISIHPAGKSVASLSTSIDVVRGKAMTIAFTELKTGKAPVVFEDKANNNKLKVQLAVYHLVEKAGPLDVLTADGNTKVFSGVAFGASTALQVNPISIELIATNSGDKIAKARTSLSMTQGGTYSILLSSADGGNLIARTAQNKIERYTGK